MNQPWRSGTLVAAVLAALAAAAAPAAGQSSAVLSVGHVDALEVSYDGGALALQVKDDTGSAPVRWDPSEVVLQALPASRAAVPDHPDFDFLGQPGDPVWILPQLQDPELLWPGWNTQLLSSGVFHDDQISITLTDATGPGAVFVYIEDFLGLPSHQFSSEPGFPDTTTVPVSTHTHANWAFTAEGTYTLALRVNATLTDGTTLSTGPVDYTFVVGEEPSEPDTSQLIVASISELDGTLVMSVDPDDRVVTMSPVELAGGADRLESTGELRPVTVTDTRPAAPGWNVAGQLGPFTTPDGGAFEPRYAGWAPVVVSQVDGQGVVAGSVVPSGFESGSGLAGSAALAGAPAGSGLGTAVLGAGLRLELPTQTPPGRYQALLTLTVI